MWRNHTVSLSSPYTADAHPLYYMLDTVSARPIRNVDWHSMMAVLYRQDIHKYPDPISFVLLSTSTLTTLIVCCSALLLILIMIRLSCLLQDDGSVNLLLVFCLQIPILVYFFGYQLSRPSLLRETSTSYINSLTFMYLLLCLKPSLPCMASSKVTSILLVITNFNRLQT